ncbi:hypothetical protein KM043_016970 [Ampulex compressa]|nr:hypothetical protein KM043_016970 [Ampulex compressa]
MAPAQREREVAEGEGECRPESAEQPLSIQDLCLQLDFGTKPRSCGICPACVRDEHSYSGYVLLYAVSTKSPYLQREDPVCMPGLYLLTEGTHPLPDVLEYEAAAPSVLPALEPRCSNDYR